MTGRYDTRLLIAAAILSTLMFAPAARAQRTIIVEPGFGTLNTAIDGDTTATGERVELNTVYVLRRGGFYLLNGAIENRFPLTIVAEEGTGDRPQLIPAVAEGGVSDRPFRPRANLTIRGLYATNRDELGGFNTNLIRMSAGEIVIQVDDCHLDFDTQAAFRFDSNNISVRITNSIVSNIGRTPDPNNGRVFDLRGNGATSIIARNNTFYNVTSRVLRVAGGTVGYAEFTNNTIVNIGQWGVTFETSQHAVLENNIFINATYYGAQEVPDSELRAVVSITPMEDQIIEVRNNNLWSDPELVSSYPAGWVQAPYLDATLQANATATISEALAFTNGPASPTAIAHAFHQDPNGPQPDWDTGPFDFSYAASAQSYSAASDGGQLGARTWFGISVGREPAVEAPASFTLHGNYPNPFNPSTTFVFELDHSAGVRISVFDLQGRQVGVADQGVVLAGRHEVRYDAGHLPSGIYVVRVEAGSEVRITRMTLVK